MELKLLYVGRVSREKNLELLADAYRLLLDQDVNVRLVIVGDGPYRTEMEGRLSGCPVLFTGYLDGEDLQNCYASADLFVFPSTTDTFGNVVLEAQASGLPVVVSDEGGPQELMIDGETGLIVRNISADSLVAAMVPLLKEPSRLSEMGRNARGFAERGADLCGDAYSTILRQPQARAANF
jgi:glycosyltransferase involved in cell wall biosynthesis